MKNTNQKSFERLSVEKKIKEYEAKGIFDLDVENDPESRVLLPEEIDYEAKGLGKTLRRFFAYTAGHLFFFGGYMKKDIRIKEIKGLENLSAHSGGGILTCNHFNPIDCFLMQYTFQKAGKGTELYKVIREGNYTSFRGFFGFLMRNCDTLPLSSDRRTLAKFSQAVGRLLKKSKYILIYPEQSMWWNYKKPKPQKSGAFDLAVRYDMPVIPTFITLEDSEKIGKDGYPVQIHTIHVGEPIYPDQSLGKKAASEKVNSDVFNYCKSIYESVYRTPLTYTCENSDTSPLLH